MKREVHSSHDLTQITEALIKRTSQARSSPDLGPTREGLKRLLNANQIQPSRVVIVAGTNGKGSICATLSSLLSSVASRVGLFTSPHLQVITERIQINGTPISDEAFIHAFEEVNERTWDLNLSFFETLTLMAAWYFFSGKSSSPVDWAIFEVGLGGTYDPTNAIPHETCIISQLGLDHMSVLGPDLTSIARNKFGIVTHKNTVIYSPFPNSEIDSLAMRVRDQTESRWIPSAPFTLQVSHLEKTPQFHLSTPWGTTRIQLPGERGACNTITALSAFEALGFDPRLSLSALEQVRWPGRMEPLDVPSAPCPLFVSGDHNPSGIQSLLELLKNYPRKHLHLLVGISSDKDRDGILGPLFSLPHCSIHLTESPTRGLSLAEYGVWADQAASQISCPEKALKNIFHEASSNDLILVTGSLYLVAKIRALSSK